jgi:hypothetical protein
MHGEINPLPVDTCIDAMRGYGRTHTTRAYEPYKQYGFREGDIAIANAGNKQVAFRVGKQYQISQSMIADPVYQQQWANMEKHSSKALPELFTGKQQVWGLYMEPLGDYVGGKIVPWTEPKTLIKSSNYINDRVVKTESNSVENCPVVTSEHLQNWYNVADKLGKSEQYKQRIMEIAADLDSGQQLSQKALFSMKQDTEEHRNISRLTQIAQRVGMLGGVAIEDGFTQVQGKMYDLTFNTDQRDLTIAQKNGEIIFSLESGKVQINRITPSVLQTFEQANNQIDRVLAKSRSQGMEI